MARFALLLASIVTASLAIAEPPASGTLDTNRKQSAADSPTTPEERYITALHEYEVRLAEFKQGRSPVNVLLQSTTRLLHVSLDAKIPDSASLYDSRIAHIESIARRNLQLGICTAQEVAQAESSRLDALLKGLIKRSSK